MQAILNLTKDLELTASRKAWILEFERPRFGNKDIKAYVPVSQSKVEDGKLWVAEWLLEPNREGVGSLLKAGHKCLAGETISIGNLNTPKGELKAGVINKGFFTVEVEGEKHRTFRFKTNKKGQTLIGVLVGQNNVSDYAWVGFVDGDVIRFWQKVYYHGMPFRFTVSHDVIRECFNAILGNVEQAGKRYATEYKNCSRCGKVLTTPESLERGLGPECAGLKYAKK